MQQLLHLRRGARPGERHPVSMVLRSGACWRAEAEGDVVVVIVWKRADQTRDEHVRDMKDTVAVLVPLAGDGYRGLVYDLRDAPSTWGPITHKAFVDVLSVWDVAARPSAVVAADEAIARLGVRALVSEGAPRHGRACASIEEAMAYAAG